MSNLLQQINVFLPELDIAPDFETLAARAPSAGDAMTPLETTGPGNDLTLVGLPCNLVISNHH